MRHFCEVVRGREVRIKVLWWFTNQLTIKVRGGSCNSATRSVAWQRKGPVVHVCRLVKQVLPMTLPQFPDFFSTRYVWHQRHEYYTYRYNSLSISPTTMKNNWHVSPTSLVQWWLCTAFVEDCSIIFMCCLYWVKYNFNALQCHKIEELFLVSYLKKLCTCKASLAECI